MTASASPRGTSSATSCPRRPRSSTCSTAATAPRPTWMRTGYSQKFPHGGAMQQLTGLDAAFLALDSATAYGHVGSVSVLDPPAGGQALSLERLTELIESRLHLVPPFRRRLVEVPFGLDQPYWIEDPDFDIEFHVRELALPAPGDDRQLAVQAARLHARPLDRRRPLWETYLIHGLEGGRQALYTKVHHAAIDGVSGNDLLAALMDTSPQPPEADETDRGARKPSPALPSCWRSSTGLCCAGAAGLSCRRRQ